VASPLEPHEYKTDHEAYRPLANLEDDDDEVDEDVSHLTDTLEKTHIVGNIAQEAWSEWEWSAEWGTFVRSCWQNNANQWEYRDTDWSEWKWVDEYRTPRRFRWDKNTQIWEYKDTEWSEWTWAAEYNAFASFRWVKNKQEWQYNTPEESSTQGETSSRVTRSKKGKEKARR